MVPLQQDSVLEDRNYKLKNQRLDISVFGLGKVGLTLVACLAKGNNHVIGVDVNPDLISSVNNGLIQSDEPGVNERLSTSSDFISATLNPVEAVHSSDISFIIVPTPSNTFGGFSLRYVLESCRAIGDALRSKKEKHIVSLVSTVLPASSYYMIIPELEKTSGRKIGDGLSYCYNPSFIALGDVVSGMESPDYILIGETDKETGDSVLQVHKTMLQKTVPISRMNLIEAEITKLASNTHETMRVSFANMLLATCSEVPEANVDRITGALSHRMGKRFFKGAIPYGGPCWPRDNKALSTFLDMIHVPSRMPQNVDLFNTEHGYYILKKILEIVPIKAKIGVIGLAYKCGTHVIERSYAVDLIGCLCNENREVVVWDPLAMEQVRGVFDDKIEYAETSHSCLEESIFVVILEPLKELTQIDWSKCQDKTVIDAWRCLTSSQVDQIGRYIPLGVGLDIDQENWLTPTIKKKLDLLTS